MPKTKKIKVPVLKIIAWEVTRSCPLKCLHCRAAAKRGPYGNELSTGECEKVIDAIVSFAKPVIILTGGEPMLRDDIYRIARYGADRGLRMVMATCGILLNDDNCKKLISAGIQRLSLSLDGASAKTHDGLRQVNGSFDAVLRAMELCRKNGLAFQVNTTVTKLNVHELQAIFDRAIQEGAVSFHPFLLVPTGRGKEMEDKVISAEEYEQVLEWFFKHSSDAAITVKPTCAPHYMRVLYQKGTRKDGGETGKRHGLDSMSKGCLGGQGFLFLSHTGDVQICGFLEKSGGNIRKNRYNMKDLWDSSRLFNRIRDIDSYKGKCGYCEYRFVCGGCRARAFSVSGDYLSEEPSCIYEPAMGRRK